METKKLITRWIRWSIVTSILMALLTMYRIFVCHYPIITHIKMSQDWLIGLPFSISYLFDILMAPIISAIFIFLTKDDIDELLPFTAIVGVISGLIITGCASFGVANIGIIIITGAIFCFFLITSLFGDSEIVPFKEMISEFIEAADIISLYCLIVGIMYGLVINGLVLGLILGIILELYIILIYALTYYFHRLIHGQFWIKSWKWLMVE